LLELSDGLFGQDHLYRAHIGGGVEAPEDDVRHAFCILLLRRPGGPFSLDWIGGSDQTREVTLAGQPNTRTQMKRLQVRTRICKSLARPRIGTVSGA
jgi:hypothetical protein